jgi:mevalonate kinase
MTSSAPAKIILFGEHAVVYGYPAIAVPFSTIAVTAEAISTTQSTGLILYSAETQREYQVAPNSAETLEPLAFAAQLALNELQVAPPNLRIELRSTIPMGGGFGSGAAVATAIMREIAAFFGHPFPAERLNALVYEVEKQFHGTPSGIDNTTIVYNHPVYFVRGQPPQPFRIGAPLTLVVADSGIHSSTKDTVADVRKYRETNPVAAAPMFERVGMIVDTAKDLILKGEIAALGPLMVENHGILRSLTVSSEQLDELVTAALEAGALGAKLSGGGRGGNVIALVKPTLAHEVAAAFRGAGAVRTWVTSVEHTPAQNLDKLDQQAGN